MTDIVDSPRATAALFDDGREQHLRSGGGSDDVLVAVSRMDTGRHGDRHMPDGAAHTATEWAARQARTGLVRKREEGRSLSS